jgi:hypothetical protein
MIFQQTVRSVTRKRSHIMKRLTSLALFVAAFGFSIAHANPPPATAPTLAAPARTGAMPDDANQMRKAQHALENAENDLLHVAHEYGGHRAKATQAITTALQELKVAQKTDNK